VRTADGVGNGAAAGAFNSERVGTADSADFESASAFKWEHSGYAVGRRASGDAEHQQPTQAEEKQKAAESEEDRYTAADAVGEPVTSRSLGD
jgi:hypothetical protein